MEATKVGIREFRADLAEYIAANNPVAVIRHCQTVGYFIPVHGQAEADLVALQKASQLLDAMLTAVRYERQPNVPNRTTRWMYWVLHDFSHCFL